MTDLNMMMRQQALSGLNAQLDNAVTNGDAEAARKITADIVKLEVSAAPKAPPYGDVEIKAELDKQPWFGTDPKRSSKAVEFGKTMDPKKFATAAAFAEAIVKAVDEEFKPAVVAATTDDAETDEEKEAREAEEAEAATTAKGKRRTDAPREGETLGAPVRRTTSGPWTKLSDAPSDVQKEINRTADKFAPKTKEGRAAFIAKALGPHYTAHQRAKGK